MYQIYIDEYAGTAECDQVQEFVLVQYVNNFDEEQPSPMIAPNAATKLTRSIMPTALVGQECSRNTYRRSQNFPIYGAHQNWSGFG